MAAAYSSPTTLYQCIHGLAPVYRANTLQPVAQISGQQRLNSSSTSAQAVSSTWLCKTGNQAFPIATAKRGTACPSKWRHLRLCKTLNQTSRHNFPLCLCHRSDYWQKGLTVIFHSKCNYTVMNINFDIKGTVCTDTICQSGQYQHTQTARWCFLWCPIKWILTVTNTRY